MTCPYCTASALFSKAWPAYHVTEFFEGHEREQVLCRDKLQATLTDLDAKPARHWRHKNRGTTYTVVCHAELQAATGSPVEGERMVIYRGEDGKIWVRSATEFLDGRFEEIPNDPT